MSEVTAWFTKAEQDRHDQEMKETYPIPDWMREKQQKQAGREFQRIRIEAIQNNIVRPMDAHEKERI